MPSDKAQLHRTQEMAKDILIRFERDNYGMDEGLMVLALVLRGVGMAIGASPKIMMNSLNRVLIRLAEVSKSRESVDRLWTPRGLGE